jgi:Bifunctional DNA primase/polymerase, N-terminal
VQGPKGRERAADQGKRTISYVRFGGSRLRRSQQETAKGLNDQHLTDEQVEAEHFQAQANALAEQLPKYSAARAASANFLVVPLDGTTPLVRPTDATNDPWQLFNWWDKWPEANPGVALGRVGGILALQVDGMEAYSRLREMARVTMYVEDDDTSYTEMREIGGYTVRLVIPSPSFSMRSTMGWGKAYNRAVNEMVRKDAQSQPRTFLLVWSFPSVTSGQDAFNYRDRKVGEGLTLLAEGVLPWQGSILEGYPEGGNVQVVAPNSRPPDMPAWLGAILGRPRSRKEMAAARASYEAISRRDNAHVAAAIAARRAYEKQEREAAIKDREQAERILAEVMSK